MLLELLLDNVFGTLLEIEDTVVDVPYTQDEHPMTTHIDIRDKEFTNEEEESDIVICQNCKNSIKYSDIPESGMGYIKCPNCGKLIDQTGKVLGGEEEIEEFKRYEEDEVDENILPPPPPPEFFQDPAPGSPYNIQPPDPGLKKKPEDIVVEQKDSDNPPRNIPQGEVPQNMAAPLGNMGAGMDPNLGAGMGNTLDNPEVEPAPGQQLSDPGRTFEMKKIFSRLLSLENYLSTNTDEGIPILKDYVTKSIELFKIVVDNFVFFKDKIDDIIIVYYKFIERVYEVLDSYYKGKSDKKSVNIVRTES